MIRFGEFAFDADTGELTGPAGTTRLQPQPAQVLTLLLARPGELFTRDELKQAVWPTTVVEADQGLNYCVRQIRAALGDEAGSGRFIETLPRRGYRLMVPVEGASVAPIAIGAQPRPRPRHLLSLSVAIVVAGLAIWLATGRRDSATSVHATRIAILPLSTTSANPEVELLDQMYTEQLVLQLTNADSSRFDIVGPATTTPLAADGRAHTDIGRDLHADFVLSGGYRPRDSTIFVQLIASADGRHVFAFRQRAAGAAPPDVVGEAVRALLSKLKVP